jgi:hypothetical protein
LIAHYKRRHLEFYTKEIRPKEDEQLKKELEEIAVKLSKKSLKYD